MQPLFYQFSIITLFCCSLDRKWMCYEWFFHQHLSPFTIIGTDIESFQFLFDCFLLLLFFLFWQSNTCTTKSSTVAQKAPLLILWLLLTSFDVTCIYRSKNQFSLVILLQAERYLTTTTGWCSVAWCVLSIGVVHFLHFISFTCSSLYQSMAIWQG